MKAKGLHCYMLSMPDDWVFHREELVKHFSDGIKALRAALKELEEFGYVRIFAERVKGKIVGWHTVVFETPEKAKSYIPQGVEPEVPFVLVENVLVQNRQTTNNDLTNNDYLLKNDKDLCEVSDPIEDIFKHWQTTLNHPRAVLDLRRQRLLERALRQYSVDDLKQAINGCASSKWHMGENDKGRIYDALTLIFRDSDHIEDFMRMANTKITPISPKSDYKQNVNNAFARVLQDMSCNGGELSYGSI